MRIMLAVLACAVASAAAAQGLAISPNDTTHSLIASQKGKRITVRLRSGQELTGLVRDASERLLVLSEVSGREFFDAAVPIGSIDAVLVRVKQP